MSSFSTWTDRIGALLLALGVTLVRLGGTGAPWAVAAAGAAAGAVFFERRPRWIVRLPWTPILLLGLAASLVRGIFFDDVLDAGVDYLVLLSAQRLLVARTARLRLQFAALIFLLVVVASVVHTGLSYPPLATAYLFLAVLDLMLVQVQAEAERLPKAAAFATLQEARHLVPPLSRAAAFAWAGALLGALFVFVFFPRFGPGVFLHGPMAASAHSGFADEVSLGNFGRIKTDPTPVLRLYVDGGRAEGGDRPDWYLRGTVLDRYAAGIWHRARGGPPPPHTRAGGYMALGTFERPQVTAAPSSDGRPLLWASAVPGFSASTATLRGRALLDDLGVDTLVAPDRPLALRIVPRSPWEQLRIHLAVGPGGTWHAVRPPGSVLYDFVARTGTPTPQELRAVGDPEVPAALAPLAQPPAGFSPRFAALAKALEATGPTRYDRVAAALRHLAAFEYTLEDRTGALAAAGQDPVETFLFESQAGHCEYFASALALLLRQMGIPARVVNGFHGAAWNAIGGFYVVRQADAHAWVEVHMGPLGWVRFDPTPPRGQLAAVSDGPMASLRQILDAAENYYLTRVIGYDLKRQMDLFGRLAPSAGGARIRDAAGTVTRAALATAAAFLGLGGLVRLRRRRRGHGLRAVARSADRTLRRSGRPRAPTETYLALAERLAATGDPAAAQVGRFARAYAWARWHRLRPGRAEIRVARKEAARLRRILRVPRPPEPGPATAAPLAPGRRDGRSGPWQPKPPVSPS